MLQVLEDGRLTDGQGRTVDFTNTVLIMTSNLPGDPQDFFKPEFFNRIDEVVRFRHLTEADIRRIVDIQIATLADRVTRRRLTLVVTDEAKDWLARAGYDADLGARPLRRVHPALGRGPPGPGAARGPLRRRRHRDRGRLRGWHRTALSESAIA